MRAYTREISAELTKFKQLNKELSGYQGGAYTELPFSLLEKRLKGSSVRAYFMRKVSEYFIYQTGNKDIHPEVFEIQLPFIWEVIIIIQYLQNQIYDGKFGVYHPVDVRNNIIAADKLKDLLSAYIDDHVRLDNATIKYLKKFVLKIFTHVNDGQAFESVYNTYKFFKDDGYLSYKKPGIKRFVSEEVKSHLEVFQPIIQQAKRKWFPVEKLTSISIFIEYF